MPEGDKLEVARCHGLWGRMPDTKLAPTQLECGICRRAADKPLRAVISRVSPQLLFAQWGLIDVPCILDRCDAGAQLDLMHRDRMTDQISHTDNDASAADTHSCAHDSHIVRPIDRELTLIRKT